MQSLADALAPRSDADSSGLVNVQAELLVLLTTLLDVVVWHLILNMITGTRTYLPLWPLLGVAVGSHVLAFVLEYRNVPSPLSDGILYGTALGSVLFVVWSALYSSVPFWDVNWVGTFLGAILALQYPMWPGLALVLFSGYLWNRALNADPARPPNVAARFEFALIVLILFGVARLFDSGAELVGPVNRAIFWFFLVGMLALALRRAQMEGTRSRPVFSTRWLLLSLAVVGGLLLVGAILATAFSRDLGAVLFQPVLVVLGVIGWVLWTVFTWVVEALFWLLTPLLDFVRSITGNMTNQPLQSPIPGWLRQLQANQSTDPSNLDPLLPVIGGAVLILALFLLWLFWSPGRRRRATAGEEDRESVWEWNMLPDLLAGLRGGRGAAPLPDGLAALARDPRYRYTVQVRQIYRQVLDLAEARGVPRPFPDTADELLPALERVLPGDPAPLRTITAVYDAVRYRTHPATADEAAAAAAAWQAVNGR
jgi:hypothetical protein